MDFLVIYRLTAALMPSMLVLLSVPCMFIVIFGALVIVLLVVLMFLFLFVISIVVVPFVA